MFGRKKAEQEDPFAALKQGGTYQSAPVTTVPGIPGSGLGDEPTIVPLAAPTPVAPSATPTAPNPATAANPTPAAPSRTPTAPRPPTLIGRSSRTGIFSNRTTGVSTFGITRVGGGTRLIVWLVTLGIIAAIAIPIISTTSNAIHSIRIPSFGFPSSTTGTPGTAVPAGPATPKGTRATNYLKPAGVRSGLHFIARRFPGASVTNLRLDNNSLDAFVFPPHGGVRDLHLSSAGTFIASGNATGQKPIPISTIPVGAVPRIVAAMKRRFHVPPSRIDYMVLGTFASSTPEWVAFSKAPSHPGFAANLDGTGLHRL